MWLSFLYAIGFLRFVSPPLVLVNPIAGTAINLTLDAIDGYVAFRAKLTHQAYHIYDKLLDYWWYLWIVIASRHLAIFPILWITFLFRTPGQFLALLRKNPIYLFWFPNILESFYVGYVLSLIFPVFTPLFSPSRQIIPLGIATAVALVREYILHVKRLFAANYLFHLHMNWDNNKTKKHQR